MIQPDKVIKSVRLTEKSNLQSSEIGQYTLEVFKEANKGSIKAAVEKVFDVTVKRVNVINQVGKPSRNRKTGKASRGSGFKKAIVTLKQGDAIDLTA
ncbi:50S ribosomal protein L23 [Pelagicoccus sp. SDUM812003]|uniref:50S ribosomal protein L23 n=1 Tax=Pelagicoccus sp. SDUM812003 TaxID=3041267 RepID=UPI00280FA5CC|nr:50S ribosomal protein L23 [Pelagicoccus sp. SDUM812003]MDQ8204849.1 50S ribosomal protein L23 [Pelagicoccus sp. SDUM812003]